MLNRPARLIALTGILLAISVPSLTAAVPEGYLDVTAAPFSADPTGASDATAALQAAINHGRDNNLVVWLPGGAYTVSDRLIVDQPDNNANFPVVLMGSTVNPANRATIVLAANSPGFGNPGARRAMLHFFNIGTADSESGNTDLYNQVVAGVDFKVLAGNAGAVALRMQGAEGCTIQDVNIDLTEGGHTGIWGVPGSGGATHRVTVTGGAIGIDTRRADNLGGGGSQPTIVVTGSSFINQTDRALYATTRGSMVLVGCRIERALPGPAIWLNHHWIGQPFDASLQLVDCEIAYASYSVNNTVIAMSGASTGRSFLLDNTHVRHAHQVWTSGAPANPSGWIHYKRLAAHVQPAARGWGQPAEPVYVDGVLHGDLLVQSEPDVAPPADLQSRHRWHDDFPSWETPGVVNVKTLGAAGNGVTDDWAAIQAAIDAHEIVFFPKGVYMVSNTLNLRPDSKLIGIHHTFSVIGALSTLANRFAGTTTALGDRPIIRTADAADADTILAFLQVRRTYPLAQHNPTPPGNYAIEWRCAGTSLLRQVKVESRPATNVRPDLIAQNYYGYNISNPDQPNYNPINPNHPQDDFLPGHWAWPNAEPNVQIRGNGGGRWYTFWFHGRQTLRAHVPFLRVEGTSEPLQIYHLHLQQQDSLNHAEIIGARNVTIYGTKGEIKGTLVYFEDCDNVRLFGNGGLTSPDPDRNPPYLFRFINCDNFQISGIGDTIREGASTWIGGVYDRWIHANLLTWQPVLDQHPGRADVVVPSAHRPILYVRGDPGPGKLSEPPPPGPLQVTITEPADFLTFSEGETVSFSGTAIDVLDGDISASATWTSSIDGLLATGASFATTTLSVGTHLITFSATNSQDLSASDNRTVTIIETSPVNTTFFTNAGSGDALVTAANWSNGLPNTEGKLGILDLPGQFTVSTSGTGQVFNGYRISQLQGTVRENGNLSLRGGQWAVLGGALEVASGSLTFGFSSEPDAQQVTLDGGQIFASGRLSVTTFSEFTLISGALSGGEWLVVGGTLRLEGGTSVFTAADSRLQTSTGGAIHVTGGEHTFNTLRLQDGGPLHLSGSGQLAVAAWDTSPGGTWAVNFAGPSDATFTVAGQNAAWFESRYTAGRLLYQGENTLPFAEVFTVTGSTVSVTAVASLYDQWAAGYGLSGPDADPLADFDKDGIVNLLEYALGGNPVIPSSAPLPQVAMGAAALELAFTRIADPELLYAVWASGDLLDWGLDPIWYSTGHDNIAGPVTVADTEPPGAGAPRFLRLSVSR